MRFTTLLICTFVLTAFAQDCEPGPAVEYGFEQRVRNEIWNNITDFNSKSYDYRNQLRVRTRAWVNVPLNSNVSFDVGLTSESNEKFGQQRELGEVVFETLYLDVKKLGVQGMSVRAGRQNLVRGESLIFGDSSAWDGSRTAYSNAVDLAYTRNNSTVELLAISNPSHDRYLPRIHDKYKMLDEWDDRAVGTYYTFAQGRRGVVEAYYFYKTETNDSRVCTNAQYQPDRFLHTWGARRTEQFSRRWSVSAEAAGQKGHQVGGVPLEAWAAYGYFTRKFDQPWNPALSFGYTALSGSWDPLFSRGAKWSEMYLYSGTSDKGLGYWTNLRMADAEFIATPKKWLKLRTTVYHMNAFQPSGSTPRVFADGTTRGNLFEVRSDLLPGEHWRGHLVYEFLLPGSYYAHDTPGYFLRWEVLYQIKGRVRPGSTSRS